MEQFRYMDGVVTLELDEKACVGCAICESVCPHGIFEVLRGRARIIDRDGCMECGACALNCPVGALQVHPGVGCAAYIIQAWIHGKDKASCGCDSC